MKPFIVDKSDLQKSLEFIGNVIVR